MLTERAFYCINKKELGTGEHGKSDYFYGGDHRDDRFCIVRGNAGIRKNLDLFGVLVLGLCVAVGGGIVRDIILGRTPPGAFRDPVYALVALGTSALLFYLSMEAGDHDEPLSDV